MLKLKLHKYNIILILFLILCIIILFIYIIYNNEYFNYNSNNNSNNNGNNNSNNTINSNENNVFLYWVGNDYKLIKILRNLIYLHSNNGKNYIIHFINKDNIKNYITTIPDYFNDLIPAHQADFIRVNVICDYGGIWLDSDTLVMDDLNSLFDIIKNKDGFFIIENTETLCNGVFGSKPNTKLMIEWKTQMLNILNNKKQNIFWNEIGIHILETIKKNNLDYYNNYKIFNGLDNMYPINWDKCVEDMLNKPYENYKTFEKDFQPVLILVNSVYKELEKYSEKEILDGNRPLNYFINKSFTNVK